MRPEILAAMFAVASCGPPPVPDSPPLPPHPKPSFRPTAIVIHSTSGLDRRAAEEAMKRIGASVHLLIDSDGTPHLRLPDSVRGAAARGMDDVAYHVCIVGGIGEELLADPRILGITRVLVEDISLKFGIPLSNGDVISRRGLFSHQQTKYRFGGLRRGEEKDRMEPGEEFMRALFHELGRPYVEEKDWVDRAADGWVCIWEGGNLGRRGDWTKGRGLTPAPAVPPAPLKLSEERRLRYVDRGPMKEVRGVVLHFTATETWDEAVRAFENRRLGPSIMVDTDGRAWQVVDRLEDKVIAAAGTNDHCIQIEIVGENEAALLANEAQVRAVAAVLKMLAATRSIPLHNRDIDSLRGVFSHGQAKKRWGRSAWMWGDDFDPGERFMKRVLEAAGGTYMAEKDWAGRRSGEWAVVEETWLP